MTVVDAVLTACPFCPCGCGLYLQCDDGKPSGVAPSRHHPISQSRLCARGWGAHEAPAWGERLTEPLVRRAGGLTPVSWGEALDAAVSGLNDVRATGKAVGVLGSARATNEENYLAARLARGGLGTGDLDSCLRGTYLPLARGISRGSGGRAPQGSLVEIEESEVVILFDGDLARSHPRAAFAVMQAVARGARLVTVSCLRTQLARLAATHVRVAPGGQQEVVAGLIASVVEAVAAESMTERRAPEPAAEMAEDVKEAGRWYAQAERASLLVAPEAAVGNSGEALGFALASLSQAAGHLGRAGSVVLPLPVRWNLRGACEMGVGPDVLPGLRPLDDQAALDRLARAWGRPPASPVGRDAAAMLGAVGGLLVVAEDPPSPLRHERAAREAMSQLDCLVVLDAFMTPTVRAAHVVLPIASHAECEGTCTSADGRVQRVRPCASPPGSARPGWLVLAELSARLDLPSQFGSAGEVLAEICHVIPAYQGLDHRALDHGWGAVVAPKSDARPVESFPQVAGAQRAAGDGSYLLTLDGVFDWGSDPLVALAPTLSRDFVSKRKLFAGGFLEMCSEDAEALGVRPGWPLRVKSRHGEATLPVMVRRELEPGLLLVPFAFREQAEGVLGGDDVVAVQATRPAG
ncbi:MAG: molybdopterin-dependent oxidoreductase [Gemmatimonadota bacterium]|nr:MAG: molybdopterin-dependent oxidoreductase [Gemmatimonadota bacterium]